MSHPLGSGHPHPAVAEVAGIPPGSLLPSCSASSEGWEKCFFKRKMVSVSRSNTSPIVLWMFELYCCISFMTSSKYTFVCRRTGNGDSQRVHEWLVWESRLCFTVSRGFTWNWVRCHSPSWLPRRSAAGCHLHESRWEENTCCPSQPGVSAWATGGAGQPRAGRWDRRPLPASRASP